MPSSNAFLPYIPTPDLSPDSGQFEKFLMMRNQNQYGMPAGYDSAYGYYPTHQYGMHPQVQYVPPSSPRPPYHLPQNAQQHYIPGQYGNQQQPSPMSRTSSAISDRPASSMGQPQTPNTPAVSQSTATTRVTNSPGPKASSNFQVPTRKSAPIIIKDPNSGAVKKFDKQPASPAPPSRSPALISALTPPPSTPGQTDANHQRAESKSVKTGEEIKNEMRDAVAKKLEADKAEEKRKKDDHESKAAKAKEEEAARLEKEKAETEAKEFELAKSQMEAENAAKKDQEDAKEAERAAEKAKEDAKQAEKARKEQEEEEEFARIEAEMEQQEREAEERYQKKKQAEKEAKALKEKEEAARIDEEMKKAEAEAEAIEEARLKKNQESEAERSSEEAAAIFAALKNEDSVPEDPNSLVPHDSPIEVTLAAPTSDNISSPAARNVGGSKQKPAALKLETTKPVEAPQPSAALQSLRSARFLTTVNESTYPPAIASPNPALNSAAPMGKFRYDRDFLVQFQKVFVEKPSETWIERVKETVGDTSDTSGRSASARTPMMGPRQPSNRPNITQQFTMGTFNAPGGRTLPPGSTSESRYQASTQAQQRPSMQNPLASFANRPGGFPMGGGQSMSRNASATSMAAHPQSPRSNTSHRGAARGSKGGKPPRENEKDAKAMPLTAGADLKPIQVSATGWKPRSVGANAAGMAGPPPGGDGVGYLAPDVVQRKVKAALNKMTPNNFDKISSQILDIVSQSKQETDGRTLRQVIQLTFEKATDEAHWAQMYAEFCKRMLESMSNEIKDEGQIDKAGNVTTGGTLFRKYLLNRCQTEFERGWKMNLPEKPEGESESQEAVMLSDEYYIAAAAKRRGLGLVRFIGELFKLSMLTARIMHMCVKKLVDFEGMPDEAEVESLTSLLRTIGQSLDSDEKAHQAMDAYYVRIDMMVKIPELPSRLRFMLMVGFSAAASYTTINANRTSSIYERSIGRLKTAPPKDLLHLTKLEHRYGCPHLASRHATPEMPQI